MDSRENGNDSSEFISIVLTEMATAISWTVKSKLLAAQEELMFQALQREVKVGAGGKIEFMAPECPEGIDSAGDCVGINTSIVARLENIASFHRCSRLTFQYGDRVP